MLTIRPNDCYTLVQTVGLLEHTVRRYLLDPFTTVNMIALMYVRIENWLPRPYLQTVLQKPDNLPSSGERLLLKQTDGINKGGRAVSLTLPRGGVPDALERVKKFGLKKRYKEKKKIQREKKDSKLFEVRQGRQAVDENPFSKTLSSPQWKLIVQSISLSGRSKARLVPSVALTVCQK